MGFQLLQPPQSEPVTLAEAKAHARVTIDDDDDLISDLIVVARELCEAHTRTRYVTQKWRMYLDAFPGYIDQRLGGNIVTSPIAIGATSYMAGIRWAIVPPHPPVQSIDALGYLVPNPQSEPPARVIMTENVDYVVDVISRPARVCPPFGKFWPISLIHTNAVWLDWTCGYGAPITVSIAAGSQALKGVKLGQSDVGKPITIPGAALSGSPAQPADLVTVIASVDANGNATLADPAAADVVDAGLWWGDSVPRGICRAIMMTAGHLYENREAVTAGDLKEIPMGAELLLSPYRDLRV